MKKCAFVILEKQAEMLFEQVATLIESARRTVLRTTNVTMVTTYFLIGRQIVEQEQAGEQRAQYAKSILKKLSKALKERFGKGFSEDNLENMRRFYLTYSISENYSRKLQSDAPKKIEIPEFKVSWSHYLLPCRIKNAAERAFYEIEAAQNHWNLEELQRQFDSSLYRMLGFLFHN